LFTAGRRPLAFMLVMFMLRTEYPLDLPSPDFGAAECYSCF
jgi:hypothetical protein